ncbi:MAG: hypothetical protein WAQ53_15395 [Thiofilum sp.]|uniref:hypothetical protein n=1 Tax=Thiofilum sp. TaxID=2212733 RepID=UPI0025CE2925|nr:hypothetical protein [Thiofilum sp.]MBK8451767.1 hypothetical protein [Thiofilum sp.]
MNHHLIYSPSELEPYYGQWLDKVQLKAIAPTVRPAFSFISSELCSGGKPYTLTPPQIRAIIDTWLERATSEGVLVRNTVGGIGKPKYLLNE